MVTLIVGAAVPVNRKNLVVLEINVKMVLASHRVGLVFVVNIRARQMLLKLSKKLLGFRRYRVEMHDGFIDLNYDVLEGGAHFVIAAAHAAVVVVAIIIAVVALALIMFVAVVVVNMGVMMIIIALVFMLMPISRFVRAVRW